MSLPLLDETEIAVIGGGPAGAIAAFTLASAGHEVLIIDKCAFPRDKACGDVLFTSAVSLLRELDLDASLDGARPIEAVRVRVDWKERERSSMGTRRAGVWIQPYCVPRMRFDHALLRLACAAGARLAQGHVRRTLRDGDRVAGVEMRLGNRQGVVTAQYVLAADGATSRLRRELAGQRRSPVASSYAVRTYVTTDEPLEPVFDIYFPGLSPHVGYGWLVPISEYVANVGIGYATARGLPRPPPITGLLDSFLVELRRYCQSELGALGVVGPISGAPLAIGPSPEGCQPDGSFLVGDAACAGDPLTGEGIGPAMRHAHACALALHSTIRRRTRSAGISSAGTLSNLRLGQDSAMIARVGYELLRRRRTQGSDRSSGAEDSAPLFSVARAMLTAEVQHPLMAETPAGQVAAALGYGDAIRALDTRFRDLVRSEFVLCSELLYRLSCAGAGPIGALMLFAAQQPFRESPDEQSISAALAVELLRAYPRLLAFVTARDDDQARANNTLAIMIGDHALSRATTLAATLGASVTAMLAEAIETNSEGAALLARDRLRQADRDSLRQNDPIPRYVEWTSLTQAASLSLATRAGISLTGTDRIDVASLGVASEGVGIATQICEDILALARRDPITGLRPEQMLAQNTFLLPLLLVWDDPEVASLVPGSSRWNGWEWVADAIRRAGGVARAGEMCNHYAKRAQESAVEVVGAESALAEVCTLPIRYLDGLAVLVPAECNSPPPRESTEIHLVS